RLPRRLDDDAGVFAAAAADHEVLRAATEILWAVGRSRDDLQRMIDRDTAEVANKFVVKGVNVTHKFTSLRPRTTRSAAPAAPRALKSRENHSAAAVCCSASGSACPQPRRL